DRRDALGTNDLEGWRGELSPEGIPSSLLRCVQKRPHATADIENPVRRAVGDERLEKFAVAAASDRRHVFVPRIGRVVALELGVSRAQRGEYHPAGPTAGEIGASE